MAFQFDQGSLQVFFFAVLVPGFDELTFQVFSVCFGFFSSCEDGAFFLFKAAVPV